jgi:hypothetical protein
MFGGHNCNKCFSLADFPLFSIPNKESFAGEGVLKNNLRMPWREATVLAVPVVVGAFSKLAGSEEEAGVSPVGRREAPFDGEKLLQFLLVHKKRILFYIHWRVKIFCNKTTIKSANKLLWFFCRPCSLD